jgi:hypothetical protein
VEARLRQLEGKSDDAGFQTKGLPSPAKQAAPATPTGYNTAGDVVEKNSEKKAKKEKRKAEDTPGESAKKSKKEKKEKKEKSAKKAKKGSE